MAAPGRHAPAAAAGRIRRARPPPRGRAPPPPPPVTDSELREQEIGAERAHHVLGAVGEVDDVEQPENHREPEREQCIERAVDQPDQQLPEQRLRRDPEDFHYRDVTSPTSNRLRSTAGKPDRRGWSRGSCNSHRGPWTPRASSPRQDKRDGAFGRPRAPCPCRTADRPWAAPSSWRSPWCRR